MFVHLPQDVKDAIFSLDVSERINVVGKRNGLTVEQLGVLGSEIGLVLLGATAVADFTNVLAEKLKISKISAGKLAEHINAEIFSPIRESLKQVHGVEDLRFGSGKEEEETTPPPTPQQLQPLKELIPSLPKKEDILGEIERGERKEDNLPAVVAPAGENLPAKTEPKEARLSAEKDIIPDIFKGVVSPNPFEVKNEQEIFRNPPQKTNYQQANLEEKKYPSGADPYRELPI